MVTTTFQIHFEFLLEAPGPVVTLEADVQEHHSDVYFKVSNFRFPKHPDRSVLPEIIVGKRNGRWVHTDSGKSTNLSTTIGEAIEARNRTK